MKSELPFFILPFLLLFICVIVVESNVINVSINFTHPLHEVNEKFVSVAFGSSMIHYPRYPLKEVLQSKKLLTLASALAPAYLRLGGTSADFVTFVPDESVGVREESRFWSNDDVPSERELEMRKKWTAYWYRCGCESESPRMSKNPRDRPKVVKREQLGDSSLVAGSYSDKDVDGVVEIEDSVVNSPVQRSIPDEIIMTGRDWDEINTFVRKTGLRLLFDVNGLKTNPGGEWNSSNAEMLLRYSAERNYSMDFQMGNEPNHYPYHVHRTVSAPQLARNYWLLRRLLESGIGGSGMDGALLVGPDVTHPRVKPDVEYLRDFLKDGINAVDAITWHQYYLNGRTATLDQFTDPAIFNVLREYIDRVRAIRGMTGPSKPIWMTETASAYGGGACGLSDRFVDGFFWLDKLGMAASMGVDVVARQTLWKGQYGLLEGDLTFEPRPDYWLTLLFKRLVGGKVLKVRHDGDGSRNDGRIRLYAHCSTPRASDGKSAVTLFGVNMMKEAVVLRFEGVLPRRGNERKTRSRRVVVKNYILQSNRDEGLNSKSVRLNGRTLRMRRDDALPTLKPVVEKFREPHQVALKMPGFGMAFYVIDGLDAATCSA